MAACELPLSHSKERKGITSIGGNDYVYEKLSLDRQEIRLCTLQPAAKYRPLSCSLSVQSLHSKPEYETLSYVWGDPSLSNEIIANGSVIKLTKNLHTALWYLRSPEVPRVIWADGICINQLDLDERSSQVGMMGDIYRQGKEVQIWLGEIREMISEAGRSARPDEFWMLRAQVKNFMRLLQSEGLMNTLPPLASVGHAILEPNVPGALRILELLAAGRHFYQMPFYRVTSPEAIEPFPSWYLSLRSLVAIFSRPWWARVWTVQESMLSAKATVHIGGYQAPLSLFLRAIAGWRRHESACCVAAKALWHGNSHTHNSLMDARVALSQFGKLIEGVRDGGLSLADAFMVTSKREASDPRDHVYALHGLLSRDHGLIKPSYAVSTDKVFSNATKALFEEMRSLNALEFAVGVERDNAQKLASWVCDWTRRTDSIIPARFYNASNGEQFRTKQTADRTLTVQACKVDVISTTGNSFGISPSHNVNLKQKVECLDKWWNLVDIKDSDNRCAFWTTVSSGAIAVGGEVRRILPQDLITIETWWQLAKSAVKQGKGEAFLDGQDQDSVRTPPLIGISVRTHEFWLASQGFFGIGPQTIEKGDEVFVAKGSKVPLIFRPIENTVLQNSGISGHERGYSFVGTCYLHGFMDGEAVKPDTKWQAVHLC